MRKLLSFILCVCMLCSCLGMLVACGEKPEEPSSSGMEDSKPNDPDVPDPTPADPDNTPTEPDDTDVGGGGSDAPPEQTEPAVPDDTPAEPQKVEVHPVHAAFSTPKLQMLSDKEGMSFIFHDEGGSSLVDIKVKTPGNKFRIYASRELLPAENFIYDSEYRAAGEIVHNTNDELTEFSYENKLYKTFMVYMSNDDSLIPEIEVFMTPKENNTPVHSTVPLSPWTCLDQPDALGGEGSFANGEWDADEIIENLFEPLRKSNPEYIIRENIGKDSSGKYDMWKYVFTPEKYTQTIYIQSGVHNREKAALLGLVRFLQILCSGEDTSSDMEYLRNNVRLVIVPIVNPWGISQKNPKNDANSNGMNLNREMTDATQQQETYNVMKVLEQYKDVLSCAIDVHSTVNANYGDYSVRYITNAQPNAEISDEIVNYLAEKNVEGTPDLHYHGISTSAGTFNWYFWSKMGIPGCTVEHADYRWDKETKYSAICMTRSVELVGNVVLNYARQEFKLCEGTRK